MVHVIAANRIWHENLPERLAELTGDDFIWFSEEKELTLESLRKLQPRYVFFPHWSSVIPAEIYEHFECVVFHMTDVPFGRGGSPLQNLIARGIYETKISALKCGAGIDAGPVYLQRPLSLYGIAEEIYLRAAGIIAEMIAYIIANGPEPVEQEGPAVYFPRRKPEEGNISDLTELVEVFDYIRMLDAEGYPQAFLETEHFRLEFQRASLKSGSVSADVRITKRVKHE